jgi:hypothetical protein
MNNPTMQIYWDANHARNQRIESASVALWLSGNWLCDVARGKMRRLDLGL